MRYQGSMVQTISLTMLFTTIAPTLADVIIDDSKSGIEYMTILSGGKKLCSQSGSKQDKILPLDETAYIFMNNTVTLGIEAPCFKNKYFITFNSKKWHNQVNRKSILQMRYTTNGLVIDTKEDIEYSKKDLTDIHSEISNDLDCWKRSSFLYINISEKNKYSWFMDVCDLEFDRKDEDMCGIYHGEFYFFQTMIKYQSNTKNILFFDDIVIKPSSMYNTVEIVSEYCNESIYKTDFNPTDFLNHDEDSESWFKFDYDVIKSGSNSSLIVSIAGIPIDYMDYETVCDEEPKFIFKGVNDIKSVCTNFNQLYNPDFIYKTQNRYNLDNAPEIIYEPSTTRYFINFPYIVILLMILICKAICGYAIYKRRQARFIAYTPRRLVEHYGNVSPIGRGTIIEAANGTDHPRQPSEDLPPAYNDLQQPSDINPPGYEDACKSQTKSPPGYENSSKDNVGFQIEEETSSVNHI